jgi:hypothetical protein
MAKPYTSRRKSDGKPRKLRKATNIRSRRRQARRIVEARRGKKLGKKQLVHHSKGIKSIKGLKVVGGQKKHQRIHPGPHNQ